MGARHPNSPPQSHEGMDNQVSELGSVDTEESGLWPGCQDSHLARAGYMLTWYGQWYIPEGSSDMK